MVVGRVEFDKPVWRDKNDYTVRRWPMWGAKRLWDKAPHRI